LDLNRAIAVYLASDPTDIDEYVLIIMVITEIFVSLIELKIT
jgi:hypothetical protein